MIYLDRYELQSKRPGCDWEHVGSVYPNYKWVCKRAWYFLWLVHQPRILNETEARQLALANVVCKILNLPKTGERTRIIAWMREGPLKPAYIAHTAEF